MSYDKTKKKETKRPMPKRKLSNISFEHDGAHLALVDKNVGGPANGHDYALVMKSTANFSEEFIEKMSQIRVTMELPDFLCKFFGMYHEDAEVLAKLMGYEKEEDEDEYETPYSDYEDYIESRVQMFEVMKSIHDSSDIAGGLSSLDEDEYLALLQDQERLEKAFKKLDKGSATQVEKSDGEKGSTEVNSEVGADTEVKVEKANVKRGDFVSWNSSGGKAYGKVSSVKSSGSIRINENISVSAEADNPAVLITVYKKNAEGGWEPTDVKVAHKASTLSKIAALKKATLNNRKVDLEENMQTEAKETVVAEFEVEVVEKSALEAIEKAAKEQKEALEKALQDQKVELQKALDLVKQFEAEKKEAITKARFASVKDAVKDEAKAEVLFKAANLIEDQKVFDEVVDVLKQLTQAVEQTDMFVEKGADVEGEGAEVKKESAVAAHIKKQAAKAK